MMTNGQTTQLENQPPTHKSTIQFIKQTFDEEEEGYENDSDDDEILDTEMTPEEKQCVYNAVKIGDIDLLEELLEKPNADIKMIWFNENLVMTAIRFDQEEMAEFLLDNGADHNHSLLLIGQPQGGSLPTEKYEYTCRQMAYDHGLFDIVEIIDVKNNQLFPGVKPRHRTIRYRREKPPTPHVTPDISDFREHDSDSSAANAEKADIVPMDKPKRKMKKLKKRISADLLSLLDDSDDSESGFDSVSPKSRKGRAPRSSSSGRYRGIHSSAESSSRPAKSVSNMSMKSTDRDSGVFSTDPERGITNRNSNRLSVKEKIARSSSKSLATSRANDNASANSCELPRVLAESISRDEKKSPSLEDLPHPPKKKTGKKFRPKLYHGKVRVARASKPLYPFQYVTDHSRCYSMGATENISPLQWRKVYSFGSYPQEKQRWLVPLRDSPFEENSKKDNFRKNRQNGGRCGVPSETELVPFDEKRSVKTTSGETMSLTKRKVEPKFRRSYTSLDFVSIPVYFKRCKSVVS